MLQERPELREINFSQPGEHPLRDVLIQYGGLAALGVAAGLFISMDAAARGIHKFRTGYQRWLDTDHSAQTIFPAEEAFLND